MPGRLRLARALCVLLVAGLLILLAVAATGAATTWDETALRNAPRTVSATQLNLALNDMDAQTANMALSSGDSGTGKGRLDESYTKAGGFYRDAQETISRSLRTLAAASEGAPATEATVVRLTDDFAHYQELIGRALENDSRAGGKDAAREDYRAATDLLAQRLLPEARKLVDANNAVYERQYAAARADLGVQRTVAAVLGVLLIAALVLLQITLVRRFNRVFNPGLIAATLCAVVAVVCGAQLLTITDDRMKVARQDSFDSVIALSRSKAIGYDANADESRYLLDPTAVPRTSSRSSTSRSSCTGSRVPDSARTTGSSPTRGPRTGRTTRTNGSPASTGANWTTSPSRASERPPRRPSRRTPSTSATTAPSGSWWLRGRSRRPRSSAPDGHRTPPTPTSASG
ncbi:hypothetical protein ABZZ20_08200 [Streptomyces sp. NPDC006430]|uniref:hypothetical protein n=1 Tax=Streptomyces sp. NPDC006430 TaxID=3154299 RepID=UPI0033BB22A4